MRHASSETCTCLVLRDRRYAAVVTFSAIHRASASDIRRRNSPLDAQQTGQGAARRPGRGTLMLFGANSASPVCASGRTTTSTT